MIMVLGIPVKPFCIIAFVELSWSFHVSYWPSKLAKVFQKACLLLHELLHELNSGTVGL